MYPYIMAIIFYFVVANRSESLIYIFIHIMHRRVKSRVSFELCEAGDPRRELPCVIMQPSLSPMISVYIRAGSSSLFIYIK